jgi:hypothetical protein
MDPLAALFAAVLHSTSNVVHDQMQDVMGTEIKAVVVDHKDQRISFQHQLWRLRDASVCADKKDRVGEFSNCTLAAKEFFADACRYLQQNRVVGWRYEKTKNMYCAASISFKPTVAFVAPASQAMPLELARRECNNLILQASAPEEERKQACARYEALKRQGQ